MIPPPAPQDQFTRYSLVYFLRPFFDADLSPLSDLSPKIADSAAKHPTISKLEKGITAGDWFKRRIAGQRVKNNIPWEKSRGTEHAPERE